MDIRGLLTFQLKPKGRFGHEQQYSMFGNKLDLHGFRITYMLMVSSSCGLDPQKKLMS
jgi:hypothetical protein